MPGPYDQVDDPIQRDRVNVRYKTGTVTKDTATDTYVVYGMTTKFGALTAVDADDPTVFIPQYGDTHPENNELIVKDFNCSPVAGDVDHPNSPAYFVEIFYERPSGNIPGFGSDEVLWASGSLSAQFDHDIYGHPVGQERWVNKSGDGFIMDNSGLIPNPVRTYQRQISTIDITIYKNFPWTAHHPIQLQAIKNTVNKYPIKIEGVEIAPGYALFDDYTAEPVDGYTAKRITYHISFGAQQLPSNIPFTHNWTATPYPYLWLPLRYQYWIMRQKNSDGDIVPWGGIVFEVYPEADWKVLFY